jgi:hypothetical protein
MLGLADEVGGDDFGSASCRRGSGCRWGRRSCRCRHGRTGCAWLRPRTGCRGRRGCWPWADQTGRRPWPPRPARRPWRGSVSAPQIGGVDDGGMTPTSGRGGEHGDVLAACDLGGGHRHDRRGDVAVAPAGHVAARGLDRDRLLPGVRPGTISSSKSVRVAFCASANLRTLSWAKRMSRLSFSAPAPQAASISSRVRMMLPSYLSNLPAYSRAASSPPASISSRMPLTCHDVRNRVVEVLTAFLRYYGTCPRLLTSY